MANVYGITFSGNSFAFDSNCARSQVHDHESPAKICIFIAITRYWIQCNMSGSNQTYSFP